MTRRLAKVCLSTALLAAPVPVLAQSDEPSPNVPVQNRARPDFDPLGIRAGAFLIFPQLSVAGDYDSNVNATPNNEEDDFGLIVSPSVTARSTWSRHALSLTAAAEGAAYQDFTDNDYFDYGFDATGRVDIRRTDTLRLGASFARDHQIRSDPNAEESGNLDKFYRGRVDAVYRHDFARFFVEGGGGITRIDWENGENADRDLNVYAPRARVGYQISPRIAAFVQGTYTQTVYDETPDDEGRDRDAKGYSAEVGSIIDFTGLIFGEFSIGYQKTTYDDNDLDDVTGLAGNGQITWNVTTLTSLIFSGSSEVIPTTVTFEGEDASSQYQQTVGVGVNHELLRNVLLNGNAAYVRDDFEGTNRTDHTVEAGFGASYLVNRHFSINANYLFTHRQSDDNDEEYDQHNVIVGVTGRL